MINHGFFITVLSLAILGMCAISANAELSGRDLYHGFASFSKGIEATNLKMPVAFMACANCHGRDGAGAAEGRTAAPSIQWSSLKQPRDSLPPFNTSEDVVRAFSSGVGRAGHILSPAMPRFNLTKEEQEEIIKYLAMVGMPEDLPRGVTSNSVRFGTMLPLSGPLQQVGEAALRGMQSVFARVNDQSGIYGRKIELIVVDSTVGTAQAFGDLQSQHVFAIIGALWQQDDTDIEMLLQKNRISAIASLSARTEARLNNSWNFPLFAAIDSQMKMLLATLEQCPAGQPIFVLAERGIEEALHSPRIKTFKSLREINLALAELQTSGCLGMNMPNINAIQVPKTGEWKRFVALPFPAGVFGAGADVWQNLGQVTAEIAVELLGASGSALNEHALLDHLSDLNGFSPLDGIAINANNKATSVFSADVVTLETFIATTTH